MQEGRITLFNDVLVCIYCAIYHFHYEFKDSLGLIVRRLQNNFCPLYSY